MVLDENKPLISVVIPAGDLDQSWIDLVKTLCESALANSFVEVILSIPIEAVSIQKDILNDVLKHSVKIVVSRAGRALQLNSGSAYARGEFLWFLHADSGLCLQAITEAVRLAKLGLDDTVYYYDLKFSKGGPSALRINEWGANFRSKYFDKPFGDQGFLMSKALFLKLGKYRNQQSEDHGFIVRAKKYGIKIKSTGISLLTSPRKYTSNGWVRTTLRHLYLTIVQSRKFRRLGSV